MNEEVASDLLRRWLVTAGCEEQIKKKIWKKIKIGGVDFYQVKIRVPGFFFSYI